VQLHTTPSPCVRVAGERPLASPLARLQLRDRATVSSLLMANIDVTDALTRELLVRLDGTRDRAALLAELRGCVATSGEGPAVLGADELEFNLSKAART